MKIELPPRLYLARQVRVKSYNCIEVDMDLGYGVSFRKNVLLEGIQSDDVPRHQRDNAEHALIVLVGGKRLLIHAHDRETKNGYLKGRVYLFERVYGNPEGMVEPYGLDEKLLEVSLFFKWLSTVNFDIRSVKAVLNGKK